MTDSPIAAPAGAGWTCPAISLGLWQNFGGVDVFETGRAMLRRAFDRGVTHFDLANNYGPPYGSAEENFGRFFADDFRPYRDELVISTKAGWDMWPGPYGNFGSRKYLIASLDQSLKRMGLDYVDIFYHHRPDPNTPLEETHGRARPIVRQGKALYVGISHYQPEETREAAAILKALGTPLPHPPADLFDAQPLDRGRAPRRARRARHRLHRLLAAGAGHALGQVPQGHPGRIRAPPATTACRSRGSRPTLVKKLNALNAIAEKRGQSLAQMALAWVLRDPRVTSALIGARTSTSSTTRSTR